MAPSDQRYTPEHVLAVVREFATIDLDPCTTPDNPVGATAFYTFHDDGLNQRWRHGAHACVYVNPPYSRGELQRWADKVVHEAHAGCEIVMLTPCDLGTRWATSLFDAEFQAMAFWRGRIAFVTPEQPYEAGAKQPSVFWYFGRRTSRFMRVFSKRANVIAS